MKFGFAEVLIILSWSSLGVSFPWYLWVLAAYDVSLRIADDHKKWLRERQEKLQEHVDELQEKEKKLVESVNKLRDMK